MSNQTTWTGNISNQWSDASNWTQGVPSMGVHAYIPSAVVIKQFPIVSSNLKVNFTLKNDGQIQIMAELYIQTKGIIQNYGTLKNCDIGTIINEGNIMNFGEWINEGTCDNKRLFSNNHRLFNNGLIDNENTFVNLGNLVNTGVIDNHKAINNAGNLENFNIIKNHGKAEIYNKGFFPEDFISREQEEPILQNNNQFTNLILD